MTQHDVERTLGRLLTDGQFRRAFVRDPSTVVRAAGLVLSDGEIEALGSLPLRMLRNLAVRIDPRIRVLELPHPLDTMPRD